jgi:hypothetical protein
VNTLILQYILGEPEWAGVLGDSDLRGITPLFTSNMSSTPTVDLPSDTPAPKQRLRSDSGCSVRRSSAGGHTKFSGPTPVPSIALRTRSSATVLNRTGGSCGTGIWVWAPSANRSQYCHSAVMS